MAPYTINNTIFDNVASDASIKYEKNENILITSCLFTNINGSAIIITALKSDSSLKKTCFYNVKAKKTYVIKVYTNKIECNITSVAFSSAQSYLTQFNSNHNLNHINHSFCSVEDRYLMILQEPGEISGKAFNFYRNIGIYVFGISHPFKDNLRFKVSQCNVIGSKCDPDSSRYMIHVNLPKGTFSLYEWILLRNEQNVLHAVNGSITFSNCWADVLEFSNGAENKGIKYENHQTFGIEAWNVPGCQFHTSGDICSDFGQRGSHRSISLIMPFLLIEALNWLRKDDSLLTNTLSE